MITKFLPEFKVFEVNNLTGLRNGHILAQMKGADNLAAKTVGSEKYIENGIICGLNGNGTIGNYVAGTHKTAFVHYTEEILSVFPELKYFAVPVEDGVVYPRCIALYAGDSFTTNNYTGSIEDNGDGYAVVENGVLKLQAEATNAMFKATASTLPTGEFAYEFLYIG